VFLIKRFSYVIDTATCIELSYGLAHVIGWHFHMERTSIRLELAITGFAEVTLDALV
jgi:hypothetical protein